MKFNKVVIIGVGLIGGSIGLAIKKKRLAKEVVGVFRHESTLRNALRCKAIDEGTMSVEEGVKDADLIILATPVASIPGLAREATKYGKNGAVITDVGSTKKWLIDKIEKISASSNPIYFVGSHPMAGSEHAGVEFARGGLLEGAPCIVTKTASTERCALNKVVNFWKALGAKVKVMSPEEHDRITSFISHLPHLVAFNLMGVVSEKDMRYAAEGFKDTTRVASSDPLIWADIFLTNKKEILNATRMFERHLEKIRAVLLRGDYSRLLVILKRAKAARDKFKYGK